MAEDLAQEAAPQHGAAAPQSPDPADLAIQDARLLAMQAQQRLLPASQFGMHLQFGPSPNELISKLDGSHITQIINAADGEAKMEHKWKLQGFWGTLVAVCVVCPLLCFMFLEFDKTEFQEKILTLFSGPSAVTGWLRRGKRSEPAAVKMAVSTNQR
jgi:hypothetical protein